MCQSTTATAVTQEHSSHTTCNCAGAGQHLGVPAAAMAASPCQLMLPAVCLACVQFKLLMNWNQEELDQWSVAQQQKEEDNQALDKYR